MSIELITKKIEVLQVVNTNLDLIVMAIAEKLQDEILKMNKDQLYSGFNSNDISIDSYKPYTIFTVKEKKHKGQVYDRVTLKDTGDFYDSLFITFKSKMFTIDSDDVKAVELKDKYGDDVLGLTDDNINKLINILRPLLIEEIKRQL